MPATISNSEKEKYFQLVFEEKSRHHKRYACESCGKIVPPDEAHYVSTRPNSPELVYCANDCPACKGE